MLGTIRMHQEIHFPKRVIGTNLINPDFCLLANAYNLHSEQVKSSKEFPDALDRTLKSDKAAVIEIKVDPDQITTNKKINDI